MNKIFEIKIPKSILNKFEKLATFKDGERCGMLLGHIKDNAATVTEFKQTTNVDDDKLGGFIIDPQEMYDVYARTKMIDPKAKLDYIGLFHTHPLGRPIPSSIDRARLNQPCVWIITGAQHTMAYWGDPVCGFNPIGIV